MSRTQALGFATALGLCLLSTGPRAGVIFDNNGSTGEFTYSDAGPFLFGPQFIADDFSLATGRNTITDVHWTGVYDQGNTPPAGDDFTIAIYADLAGAPAPAPLHSLAVGNVSATDTGIDTVGSLDVYEYSVDIAPITLTAGADYWLSIFNDTTGVAEIWGWSGLLNTGTAAFRLNPTIAWATFPARMNFQLTDDSLSPPPPPSPAPEPATLLMAGLGIAALARRRRRSALARH